MKKVSEEMNFPHQHPRSAVREGISVFSSKSIKVIHAISPPTLRRKNLKLNIPLGTTLRAITNQIKYLQSNKAKRKI